MSAPFQLAFDASAPEVQARFWTAALGSLVQPPPEGFATWEDALRAWDVPDAPGVAGGDSRRIVPHGTSDDLRTAEVRRKNTPRSVTTRNATWGGQPIAWLN